MEDDRLLVLELADKGGQHSVEFARGNVLGTFDVAAYVVCEGGRGGGSGLVLGEIRWSVEWTWKFVVEDRGGN